MISIKEITDEDEKTSVSLKVMHNLPKWFSPPEDIERKAIIHREYPFFVAFEGEIPVGFLTLKVHNEFTADIFNMGILEEYHRQGIGKLLVKKAENYCLSNRFKYLTVKTLDSSADYEPYQRTRNFYRKVGFTPLEVFTTFWNEENPCLFLAKHLDCVEFVLESTDINEYLKSDKYIDFYDKLIQQKANELFALLSDEKEKIKAAYEFVRDEIHHSGDIDSERVTKSASEVLKYKEGICIGKSLLLAAILRCGGIPAGLCYQRLTEDDTPDSKYLIHGLNAVFLSDEKRWIRLDARGNKHNVDAQFSIHEEKLAWPVRVEYGEIDYPTIYATPHPMVMEALEKRKNRREDSFDISDWSRL